MKTALLKRKDVVIISETPTEAEVVFMNGETARVNIFDLSDIRWNTTTYNPRSVDFLALSEAEQILFIQKHRSERARMRAECLASKRKVKTKKAPAKRKKKAKVVLSPERQAVLDALKGLKL